MQSHTFARGALACALAAAVGTLWPTAPADAAGPGTLILVGGALADTDTAVYQEIIAKAGGSTAKIGVITAASIPESQDPDAGTDKASNSVANGAYYSALLKKYGAADAQWIPVDLDHVDAADSQTVVDQINGMSGFFFGGGDQSRLITTLLHGDAHTDTRALAAIRAKLGAGAMVAGSSAGTTIQNGRDMITGGESYEAVRDGSSTGAPSGRALTYLSAGGFGFFDSDLLDTHFAVRGREGRLIRLAADTGHRRAFGIDEDTALEVTGVGASTQTMRVLGTHGVSIFDLRSAKTGSAQGEWSISGVRWSYLTGGDRYDPSAWSVTPDAGKSPFIPYSQSAESPSDDIFDSPDSHGPGYTLTGVALDLGESGRSSTTYGRTYEDNPTFAVDLTKKDGYQILATDNRHAVSFTDLTVDISAS
ncbi:cyanophycinase [Nocardia yunnanensis]|uniref:cyanophycinase n=1 Tax=Nocardia yunnanensis TaxID=2382165 RepID=UPI001CA40CF0|nr:cyanophycinase [Nocardia yunnanensis]